MWQAGTAYSQCLVGRMGERGGKDEDWVCIRLGWAECARSLTVVEVVPLRVDGEVLLQGASERAPRAALILRLGPHGDLFTHVCKKGFFMSRYDGDSVSRRQLMNERDDD